MVVPALPPGRGAPLARWPPSRLSPRRRVIRGVLAAGALGALGAVAIDCNLVLGTGDYGVGPACPSGDCAACGQFTYAAAACGTCNQASCCAEAESCRKSPACAARFDCHAACPSSDGGCVSACDRQHPAGADAAAAALSACQTKSCVGSCPTCGGLVDWYAKGCGACVATTCCGHASACAADAVCAQLEECYRGCTYPSCPMDCQSMIEASSGQPLGDVVAGIDTCTSVGCRTECGSGAHWGCVGAFSWPAATPGAMVSLKVHATAFSGGAPYPGATIRACGRPDVGCAAPLTSGTTAADGTVTLSLPSGFVGYLDATGPNTLESLVYLAWPLTMSTSTYDLLLGPYELYKSLVMADNGTVDDTPGALFVYTRDCLGAPAPGVALAISPSTVETKHFYFLNGSPIDTLDATAVDAIGGFANVPPGTVTLTAHLGPKGKKLGLFTVQVRPMTLTYVTLTPTPS